MNTIKIIAANGDTIETARIATGGEQNARRLPAKFARAYLALEGATLELETIRGWVPRVVVKRGRSWYTRVPR
jgi:hypothetical protein